MNVVDSSAWLSYFAGDTNSGNFARAIEDLDRLLVPTIALTEVFKSVLRQRGEEAALEVIAHMEQGQVVPLDAPLALEAAKTGVELRLPLANSIIYATAKRFGATVWTQDSDFDGLDDVRYYAKPSAT